MKLNGQKSLDVGPDNVAVDIGDTVVLECAGTPDSGYRVQWTEYAYSSQGTLISENNIILDHPQKARYALLQPTSDTFNLQISDIVAADGGTYVCQDVNGFAPQFYRRAAQLIVISEFYISGSTCQIQISGNFVINVIINVLIFIIIVMIMIYKDFYNINFITRL